jgi:hypothetical protein
VINFLDGAGFLIGIEGCDCPFRSGVGGDESIVDGVWGELGDDDNEEEWEEEGLEGSKAGTLGTLRWVVLVECERVE